MIVWPLEVGLNKIPVIPAYHAVARIYLADGHSADALPRSSSVSCDKQTIRRRPNNDYVGINGINGHFLAKV